MAKVVWVELMTLIASKTSNDIADLRYLLLVTSCCLSETLQQGRFDTKLRNSTESSLAEPQAASSYQLSNQINQISKRRLTCLLFYRSNN
jgi:hypothetical protein